MKRWLYGLLVLAFPAYGQKAPVPDPRLEPLYSSIVIANVERSVMFERTLPQPPASERPKPRVDEPGMARVGDGIYVERSLLAAGGASDDPGAVRIFRRDGR